MNPEESHSLNPREIARPFSLVFWFKPRELAARLVDNEFAVVLSGRRLYIASKRKIPIMRSGEINKAISNGLNPYDTFDYDQKGIEIKTLQMSNNDTIYVGFNHVVKYLPPNQNGWYLKVFSTHSITEERIPNGISFHNLNQVLFERQQRLLFQYDQRE